MRGSGLSLERRAGESHALRALALVSLYPRPDRRGYYKNRVRCTLDVGDVLPPVYIVADVFDANCLLCYMPPHHRLRLDVGLCANSRLRRVVA